MKIMSLFAVLSSVLASDAMAGPLLFRSDVKQVSLVELYTSEGCSSCPPAEDWLNRLKDSPGLWTNFVPVAFHVDYWNSLGWPDRWSSPEFSARQRDYAQLWRADNVYTPCFVLNGAEWHGWLGRREVPASPGAEAGVLEARLIGTNLWNATFIPAQPAGGNFEIHAALLAAGLGSDVKAGENRGRKLHHEFAALELVSLGMANHHGIARGKFIINSARDSQGGALALAVWVTRPGELLPVQATGGWLGQPQPASK